MINQTELIKFIAEYLYLDEKLILKKANIRALCAISLCLADQDPENKIKYQINLHRIDETIDKPEQSGRNLNFDITKYFKLNTNERILLSDTIENDGFYDLQLKKNVLILEIEQLFNNPHNDDELFETKLDTIDDLIKFYDNIDPRNHY